MPNTNDKNQIQLNAISNINRRDVEKGFTLVELIVTLAVLGIMLTLTVSGLLSWRDWSDFNRVNEYAETMFLSAQNQLSEYNSNGTLQDFSVRVSTVGVDYVPVESIIAEDGLPLTQDIDQIASEDKHYIWMSENKGTLVCVRAEKGDYSRYIQGADTKSETAPFVFELLNSYIYDQSILNETICIEFSLEDGQVFSVLFTDKHAVADTDEYSRFVYSDSDEDRGNISILNRVEGVRKEKMTGYYGVDTLSKAIKGGQKKIAISNLMLHNADTLYLSFGVSNVSAGAVSALNYDITIRDADEPDRDFLTFTLDGTKLKNKINREAQTCVVTRNRYEEEKNSVVAHELGDVSILAWVNDSGKVELLLDAADFQANTMLYSDAMNVMLTDNIEEDTLLASMPVNNLLTTYSFHRFGLDVDNIYCEVKAYGSAYKASPVKKSNTEAVYFETVSLEENEAATGSVARLSVANARHLNNIRYIADFSEAELEKYWATYTKNADTTISYQLTEDIDWKEFIDAGFYFDTKMAGASVVEDYEGQFVSIKQIGQGDEFDGNSHTITGLHISEINNASAFLYEGALEGQRPVGFVCTNTGCMHDLALDQIQVYSNSDKAGAFCGVNICTFYESEGRLYKLSVLNSSDEEAKASTVTGKEHVGGIVGYVTGTEDTHANEGSISTALLSELTNEAEVSGIKYVGGIVGEICTPKQKAASIVIFDCENTGNTCARTTVGANAVDAQKCGFIGGIVGYMANRYEAANGQKRKECIQIVDCVSTPKYFAFDATAMEDKLNGVYVGGIAGYNYYGVISNCSTKMEDDKMGSIYGHSFVGGIVGYNCGRLSDDLSVGESVNRLNVIGQKYVGGIAGCNARLKETQEIIEAFETEMTPERERYYDAELCDWENQGYILATDSYAGGISGYNTGWVYNCENNMDGSKVETGLKQRYSGDYVGGLCGYNNGIVGNTRRNSSDKTQVTDTLSAGARRKAISCDVSGANYSGGIVGYNDEAAIIEDYEVEGGFVRGTADSCFVGGLVGFNASLDLLQYSDGTAKTMIANLSSVSGGCFVGGVFGGNMINTNGYSANAVDVPIYSALTVPEVTDDNATETPIPGQSGPGVTTETPTNDYTLSFSRTSEYQMGENIIAEYTITPTPVSGNAVRNWRIEFDIPEGVDIGMYRCQNHNFEIANNKFIITPLGTNDVLYSGIQFALSTKTSIAYFRFSNTTVRLYVDGILRTVLPGRTTEQNRRDYEVTLTNTGIWNDNNTHRYIAGYSYSVINNSGQPVEGWGFEVDASNRNFDIYSGWVRYEKTSDKLIILPQHIYNNVIAPYSRIEGSFQIIGDTRADVEGLGLEIIQQYEYYDGEQGTPNEPPVMEPQYLNKYAIHTNYSTNNNGEIVSGNAFVGGFVGYNLFLDNSNIGNEAGYIATLSKQLVAQMHANNGSLATQYRTMKDINSISGLTSNLSISDVAFVVNGQSTDMQTVCLNKVEGNICVGGVFGFNHDESLLYIKNTRNQTPIYANETILDQDNQSYSYAGGIIGSVGPKTVIENCVADQFAVVSSSGNYTGAICEANAGYILNCSSAMRFANAKEYAAGLCGINRQNAMIKDSMANNTSVVGWQMAGALVAVNYGYIDNPSVDNCIVSSSGSAGGVAAYNGVSGIIRLVHNISDIHIESTGNCVGGVVGSNDGVVVTASAEEDYKITVTGAVSGNDMVGGIAGKNSVHDNNSKIGFFSNHAMVTAQNGTVGGIVGYHAKESSEIGRIADCENYGTVISKGSGFAGGICAVNDMKVLRCVNHGEIYAAEGKGAGIVADNRGDAIMLACTSHQEAANYEGDGLNGGLIGVCEIQQLSKEDEIEICEDDEIQNATQSDVETGETENQEETDYYMMPEPSVMIGIPGLANKDSLATLDEYYDGEKWSKIKTKDDIKALSQRAIVIKEQKYADTYEIQIMNDTIRKISICKRFDGNQVVYDVYYLGCDSGWISSAIGEPYSFWMYLGSFDAMTDVVSLPFAREFSVELSTEVSTEDTISTLTDALSAENVHQENTTIQFYKNASIHKTNDGFMLVLPYEWDEFNGKVTVQACASDENTAYVDSLIGCYDSHYETDGHVEEVFTVENWEKNDEVLELKASATTEMTADESHQVVCKVASPSNISLAQIIVLDENNAMLWTEYKQILPEYNTVDTLMHGSFAVDVNEYFMPEQKQSVFVRFARIDTYGLGTWTQFYKMTPDGINAFGSLF